MKQKYFIEPDRAAALIRAFLAINKGKGFYQQDVARKFGISPALLSMYLNRKLNLMPALIEAILDEFGIRDKAIKLSAPAEPVSDCMLGKTS